MELGDVNDWLDSFEMVSHHNGWDATTKINNVVSYLSGVAKTWLSNHEFDLRNSAICLEDQLSAAEAQQKLAHRVQQPRKSYISYIEDVIALCNRMDPRMTE